MGCLVSAYRGNSEEPSPTYTYYDAGPGRSSNLRRFAEVTLVYLSMPPSIQARVKIQAHTPVSKFLPSGSCREDSAAAS